MGIRHKIPIGLAKDLLFQFFGVEKIFGDAKNPGLLRDTEIANFVTFYLIS